MLGIAQEAGHEITPDAKDADVLVVNTCAFIDRAKQESIDTILEMAQQKRDGKCSRLVVTGCLAERYRDELRKEIPEIDAVLGTGEVPSIVEAIQPRGAAVRSRSCHFRENRDLTPGRSEAGGAFGPMTDNRWAMTDVSNAEVRPLTFHKKRHIDNRASNIAHRQPPTYLYDANTPRVLTTPRHFAYVKVAEGCDYTCAFCI